MQIATSQNEVTKVTFKSCQNSHILNSTNINNASYTFSQYKLNIPEQNTLKNNNLALILLIKLTEVVFQQNIFKNTGLRKQLNYEFQ